MTTKHAAALAALDAGCLAFTTKKSPRRYFYILPQNLFAMPRRIGTLYDTPIDALAAAAEALGLESRYVVTERTVLGVCFRCGHEAYVHEQETMVWGYNEKTDSFGWVCADGCNSEETKTLRKADTPEAKAIWKTVEEAAKKVPDWARAKVDEVAQEVVDRLRKRNSEEEKR